MAVMTPGREDRADYIAARAGQVRFWRTVAVLLTGVFFGAGWLLAKGWFLLIYCGLAVAEGWKAGRASARN